MFPHKPSSRRSFAGFVNVLKRIEGKDRDSGTVSLCRISVTHLLRFHIMKFYSAVVGRNYVALIITFQCFSKLHFLLEDLPFLLTWDELCSLLRKLGVCLQASLSSFDNNMICGNLFVSQLFKTNNTSHFTCFSGYPNLIYVAFLKGIKQMRKIKIIIARSSSNKILNKQEQVNYILRAKYFLVKMKKTTE